LSLSRWRRRPTNSFSCKKVRRLPGRGRSLSERSGHDPADQAGRISRNDSEQTSHRALAGPRPCSEGWPPGALIRLFCDLIPSCTTIPPDLRCVRCWKRRPPGPTEGILLAREQRKLAAIMAADVVGYARLMGRDEAGTLLRLNKLRSDCLSQEAGALAATHGLISLKSNTEYGQ
jgi:hypothetical protein